MRSSLVPKRIDKTVLLAIVTVGFVALMAFSSIIGFVTSSRQQLELDDSRLLVRDIHALQQGLIDGETGIRGFVLTRRLEYLEPYFSGLQVVDDRGSVVLPGLDAYAARSGVESHPVSNRIDELRHIWIDVVALAEDQGTAAAQATLEKRQQKRVMDEVRLDIATYIAHQTKVTRAGDLRIAAERRILLGIDLSGALIAVIALTYAFRSSAREASRREVAMSEREQTTWRVEQVSRMTNMLQSATDRDDANQVLCTTAIRLLPGFSGILYVLNNSRDRLDLSTTWGPDGRELALKHIPPATCWALKLGRPHLNCSGEDVLRCQHHPDSLTPALELPMAARGQVYGLLVVVAGERTAATLATIEPIASTLADAMSLALSSMSLREQLRDQALRDPLTGLYNRRFMDEMLERLGLDAQRRKTSLAAIMIDLDHFKRLNDQYGHATGDAVLRDVAGVVTSMLRATDIACRYGGEELALLLPDCPLEMAMVKAEALRVRITELAPGPSGVTVTASLGVAVIPDTTATVRTLLANADGALYQAKQNGRNCVAQAGLNPQVDCSQVLSLHRTEMY